MKFIVKHKIYTYSIILSFLILFVIRYITVENNTLPKLLMDGVIQSMICIIADMVWNAPQVGVNWASKYVKNQESFAFDLLAAIVPSIYYGLILNFTGLYLSLGDFTPDFLSLYFKGLPLSFIVGYVASLVVSFFFAQMEKRHG